MKRNILFWTLALLLPLTATAAPASLSIESGFDIKAGEEKEMVICLTNPDDDITLVQFDLRLPAGLTLKSDGGDYVFDMAGRTTWRKHSLDVYVADGAIRFLLSSASNTVITGTEGAIITMTIVADGGFTGGEIRMENILLVTPDEKETKQEDYVYAVGEQTPPDRAWLYVDSRFFIGAGMEKEMNICMANPEDEITLVQLDLRLPAGLSLKQDGGDYVADIAGRTTSRKHSLDVYAQPDGSIRFLLASNSNALLSGTDGAIIKVTLVAGDTFTEGSVISLENILLVSPDETTVKPANVAYEVVRPKGDVNADGTVDVADIATVISVMAGDATLGSVAHYADVNGDGTVDVADIATIISEMAALARRQQAVAE